MNIYSYHKNAVVHTRESNPTLHNMLKNGLIAMLKKGCSLPKEPKEVISRITALLGEGIPHHIKSLSVIYVIIDIDNSKSLPVLMLLDKVDGLVTVSALLNDSDHKITFKHIMVTPAYKSKSNDIANTVAKILEEEKNRR